MELLVREIGLKALTDGFCEIYGEKHREFFTQAGSELVDLGYEGGKKWVDSLITTKADRMSSVFKMIQDGIVPKEQGEAILAELRLLFNEEDVQKYSTPKEDVETNHQFFMSESDKYIKDFTDCIIEDEVKMITTKHFDYFKRFQLSPSYKTVTLFSESGLGLDQYNKKDQEYMKFEGELFYAIEGIPRKYFHFGQLLAKEDAAVHWIKFISEKLTNETNYWVAGFFRDVICVLVRDIHKEEVISSIQRTVGIDIDKSGFISHKQVSQRLNKLATERIAKESSNNN